MAMVFEIIADSKKFTIATAFDSKSISINQINDFITDWKHKKVVSGVLSKDASIDWKITA